MIAAVTSIWINFLKGTDDEKALQLDRFLQQGAVVMPPPVLMELLSFRGMKAADQKLFALIPELEILEGFLERAGEMRHNVLKKGLKARSMDCLIAQSCIDHDIALVTSDQDCRHLAKFGLKLV